MKNKDIVDAWAQIRGENYTIPDDVLDFMKDAALAKLKESPTDPETLTNTVDGSVEDAAKKYLDQMAYNGVWETEQMIEMFIAGASTNQQRKCQDACDWPDCTLKGCVVKGGQQGGDAQLLLDMVTEYINLEKVVSDKKAYKKFEAIVDKVFSGYYAQSTTTPPGFLEKLRAANPFDHRNEDQAKFYQCDGWNECCDMAATLLSAKPLPEKKQEVLNKTFSRLASDTPTSLSGGENKEEEKNIDMGKGECVECKKKFATKDHNGHGHYVCENCYDHLSNEFEREYQ